MISGVLTVLAGVATLFVMAMIYRPVAPTVLGGAFTIASFFAAALALGGVMTAMWLGHWYLVTPALSEKPLQFATTLVLLGVLAQVIFAVTAGPTITNGSSTTVTAPAATATAPTGTPVPNAQVKPVGAPVATPLGTDAIGWLRILVSFVIPLVLGGIAWKLIRDRSFQSATGMLYLVVVCTLAGEALARGLFLIGI
jgi:DMSO reductase anchor subunit